jgi:hypothetical protein
MSTILPPKYAELVKFLQQERAKPYFGPLNCWVMNKDWRDRLADESPVKDDGFKPGPFTTLDYALGLPVYLDEAYTEPIMRNQAEYLAEKETRG